MELDWKLREIEEWRSYLLRAPRANYLQSIPFAGAILTSDHMTTRIAVIRNGTEELGLMAVNEIKLGPIHVVYLYRGPLWFREDPPDDYLRDFGKLLNQTFPRRFLRFRKWLPEWKDSVTAQSILRELGFRSRSETYETIFLDLTQTEEQLRRNLKANWRNHLNKGEKSGMTVSVDWKGTTTKLFLRKYELDRKEKKYPGRTAKFIRSEIATALVFQEMFILWASKDGKTVAAILVLLHGNSASYRIGWTTEAGRACDAHNVLLWRAIKILKEKQIRYFDLVGIEPTTAQGLTAFKSGMGGESFKTVGMFR